MLKKEYEINRYQEKKISGSCIQVQIFLISILLRLKNCWQLKE